MTYPSTQPRVYQIDVIDQVSRAYRSVFEQAQTVGEIALIPFLILLAIELAASMIFGLAPTAALSAVVGLGGAHALGLALLFSLLVPIAMLLVFAVFAVRWYRYLLLGERVGDSFVPPGWVVFIVAGLKLAAVFVAGWLVLLVIALLPPHLLTAPLAAVGTLALMFALLRFSLIFPAAAIERPIGLRTAWDWLSGNYWRLFLCSLACYLPFAAVQFLVGAVGAVFPAAIAAIFTALHLAVSFAGAAVAAALLSGVYREFAGGAA